MVTHNPQEEWIKKSPPTFKNAKTATMGGFFVG
jgi:hypothetical protein